MKKSLTAAREKIKQLIEEKTIFGIDGSIVCKFSGLEMQALEERIDELSESEKQKVYMNIAKNYIDTTEPLKAEDYPSWAYDD